jgi:hypothetical protein
MIAVRMRAADGRDVPTIKRLDDRVDMLGEVRARVDDDKLILAHQIGLRPEIGEGATDLRASSRPTPGSSASTMA